MYIFMMYTYNYRYVTCGAARLRTWPVESWDAWAPSANGVPAGAAPCGAAAPAPAPMPGWLGRNVRENDEIYLLKMVIYS